MRGLLLTLVFFVTARAEILDRVVAVVNSMSVRHVITLSDVQKEREIQRVIGRNFANDQDVVNFLIERYLVEDQMQFTSADLDDAEIDAHLAEIKDLRGVPRSDVKDALRRELKAERYYDTRFGQFIRPTDQELHAYYDNVLAPDARAKRVALPSFEELMRSPEAAADLVKGAIKEKRNRQVEDWLKDVKKRSAIETF